jgi:hypothetical protein
MTGLVFLSATQKHFSNWTSHSLYYRKRHESKSRLKPCCSPLSYQNNYPLRICSTKGINYQSSILPCVLKRLEQWLLWRDKICRKVVFSITMMHIGWSYFWLQTNITAEHSPLSPHLTPCYFTCLNIKSLLKVLHVDSFWKHSEKCGRSW